MKKIFKTVDETFDEFVCLLKELVSINSIGGQQSSIIDYIAKKLENLRCDIEVFEGDSEKLKSHPEYCPLPENALKSQKNIAAVFKGTGGGKSLLIFSHVDTEDIKDIKQWKIDPFTLTKIGDKLYGLGAADAKSGVAACIAALTIINELAFELRGDVIFLGVNGKLGGSAGTLPAILKGYKAEGGIYVHAPETGNGLGEIKTSTVGVLPLKITVYGKAPVPREIGNPQNVRVKEGINAIDKALKIISALKKYSDIRDKTFNQTEERTVFNLGTIRGGEAPGAVPKQCEIGCYFSFSTNETVHSILEEVKQVIAQTVNTDNFLKEHPPKIEMIGLRANPASIKSDHELVKTLKQSIKKVSSSPARIYNNHQASDIRFPILYGGTPTLGFGPKGGCFFGANEWVSQKEYLETIKVLIDFIISWCG